MKAESTIGIKCLVGDGAHASIKRVDIGVPYLSSKNFKQEGIDLSLLSFISEQDYQKHFKESSKALTKPKTNDLILSIIGSIGSPYLVKETDRFGISSSVALLRTKEEIHPLFLFYYLKTDAVQNYVEAIKSGSAQGFLSLEMIKSIPIQYPSSIQTQQNIASNLAAYDDLIEVNKQRIKLLEQTARELYKEWFVRMRFPNYKKTKVIKGLPQDWEIKELQDFGKIFTGKTPPTKVREYYGGDIPFIKTPDLHKSLFVFDTEENLTEKGNSTQKRSTLPANSICVSCIGTGGIVSITTAEKSQTNQQINSLVPSNLKQLEFLYHRIVDLKETIELFGGTGATMTNLSKGKFEKLKILFPKNELVEKYHFLVNPMFNQIKTLQQQNILLRQIRDRLLPRLISGKLQVKTDSKIKKSVMA